ncbi:MAG: helix-hairpin-helix domain-containing protein [Bacilli bacterium]|nr:helix-hairpin-helix domain-containing protein [Bacilli bacterium]
MAGGLTKNADTSLINLSMKLKDEMTIKIYSKLEIENAKKSIIEEPKEVEIIKEVEKIVEVEKECLCKENDVCINDSNEEIIVNNKEAEEQNTIAQNNDVLVNINTATLEELMTINGIGESKALKIIEYRNINSFEHIEDIMNVAGIGNALFEKIKAYITV